MSAVVLWIGWATVAYGVWWALRGLVRRVRVLLLLRRATYRAPKIEVPEEIETALEVLKQKYGD